MKIIKKVKPIIISWILFGVSIIISSLFFYKLSKFYSISDKTIDLNITNGIGNFIGGILGPIFSLIGSLLIFETIRLQRKTLKSQKKETKFERDLNIFMKYIDKIDKTIENFHIDDKKDLASMKFLFLETFSALDYNSDEKNIKNTLDYLISIKQELSDFSYKISIHSKVIKKIKLDYIQDSNEKNLFKSIIDSTFEIFSKTFMNNFIILCESKKSDFEYEVLELEGIEKKFKEILENIDENPTKPQ